MDDPPSYVVVNGIELSDVERKVNDLIAKGYSPQPMLVSDSGMSQTRPRYIVPMVRVWVAEDDLGTAFVKGLVVGIEEGTKGTA